MRTVTFSAGWAWNSQGRPSSYSLGTIGYEWNEKSRVFHVQTETAIGTRSVYNYSSSNEKIKTCEELDKILHNMKGLEAHYKKVYEI